MGWLAAGLGAAVLNLVLALLANSHEPCYAGNKCKGPPGDAAEVKQSSVHVSAASMCLQCHIAYAVNKATLHVCIATPATLLSLSVLRSARNLPVHAGFIITVCNLQLACAVLYTAA